MEIEGLRFGIISPATILAASACEVKHEKPKTVNLENTLYDPRMGPIEDGIKCPTCKLEMAECPGHFGHMILNAHIIYPLPIGFKTVYNFLKSFCFNCSRLVFSGQKLDLLGISTLKNTERYQRIVKDSDNIEICWNCNAQVAKFYIQSPNSDPKIMMRDKLPDKKNKDNSKEVDVSEIERVFEKITNDDLHLFGFNSKYFHPKNLILSIIPIIPPCARPYIFVNDDRCEDDLTTIYRSIGKINESIRMAATREEKNKSINSLSFFISILMDNSKGIVKQPNGRPKKCIKGRLSAKGGLFRQNLLGKRTNYSARTVVGGDPTLEADQIFVPDCIATRVTIPEMVCRFNIERLTKLVNSGQAEFVYRTEIETGKRRKINLSIATKTPGTQIQLGDKVFRKNKSEKEEITITENSQLREGDTVIRKGTTDEVEVQLPRKRHFTLLLGDEVRRHLQDNDWVILNRQPTLHVGSMLAVRVKRQPGSKRRSIGVPLNLTTPQNMDFDGDEANIHVPQTLEAKAEYRQLISVTNNVFTHKPIMGIVQDSLLSCYLLTQGWVPVAKPRFDDICVRADLDISRFEKISKAYMSLFNEDYLYTGRGLLSLAIPDYFSYSLNNKAYEKEPIFKIRNGVIIEGSIDKSTIGPSSGAIHHYMSNETAILFLTKVQLICNLWMQERIYSIGIKDCIPVGYDENGSLSKVKEIVTASYSQASLAEATQTDPVTAEMKVSMALNAARDLGKKIAKDALAPDNRFLPFTNSKSKGSFDNLCQISGLLGQQNVAGRRMDLSCIGGNRSLPHYRENEEDPERKYESRGFIRNSFVRGLTPVEHWAHAWSSREGIVSTVCTTARTGYLQRRMTEMLKNLTVQYDHTVRNSNGRVIQFIYGGDGLSYSKQHKVDGTLQCSLATRIEEINLRYETEKSKMECFRDNFDLSIDQAVVRDDISVDGDAGSEGSVESPASGGSRESVENDYDD